MPQRRYGTALCTQVAWVSGLWGASRTPICPTEVSAGRRGLVWLQKEARALQEPLGWFCGWLLAALPPREGCLAQGPPLPPAQPQGFSPGMLALLTCPRWGLPQECFWLPAFPELFTIFLESFRKQAGFGRCL